MADITNGIWLCRNCHKAADGDPVRFPADLLFEWRRRHEIEILAQLGKPGDQARSKIDHDRLRPFATASNLAQQIVLDRPPLWEYKLAVELLRSEFGPVLTRWKRLERGMYARKSTPLDSDKVLDWFSAQIEDVLRIVAALNSLLQSLTDAFGLPGQPGDEKEILEICRLIVAAAENLLRWEEDVRFVYAPERCRPIVDALQGAAGQVIQDVFGIEAALAKIVGMESPSGVHEVTITIRLPDGWERKLAAAFEEFKRSS